MYKTMRAASVFFALAFVGIGLGYSEATQGASKAKSTSGSYALRIHHEDGETIELGTLELLFKAGTVTGKWEVGHESGDDVAGKYDETHRTLSIGFGGTDDGYSLWGFFDLEMAFAAGRYASYGLTGEPTSVGVFR